MRKMEVLLGYCCTSLVYPKIKTSNTTTFTYLNALPKKQRAKYIKEKTHENLGNLLKLLQKNYERDIIAFRLTDTLLPFADLKLYDLQQQHGEELSEIGKLANKYEMYLSYHPAQVFVLNSINQKVVQSTVNKFNVFGKILSLMNLKNTPVLLTHVGGIKNYNNYEEACDAFCNNFQLLSPLAKKYLAVQNDQHSHSINSCMYIHDKIGIPVVVDHAHYKYNPVQGVSLAETYRLALRTWKNGRVPKIHLCSQAANKKVHCHGDFLLYQDYKFVYQSLLKAGAQKVIMMLQVKRKDQALMKLRQQIAAKNLNEDKKVQKVIGA